MTWPEPSMSVGPPPPKRHRQVPTATVSHSTAQEAEAPSPVPEPQWGNIPTEMTPLHVNVGTPTRFFCCQVKGCPEGPSSSCAAICFHVCHTHLGMKLSCPLCPIMFFNTNVSRQHSKSAHHSGSSDPT